MEKQYEELKLKIISFDNADIITDSYNDDDDTIEIKPGGNNGGNN